MTGPANGEPPTTKPLLQLRGLEIWLYFTMRSPAMDTM